MLYECNLKIYINILNERILANTFVFMRLYDHVILIKCNLCSFGLNFLPHEFNLNNPTQLSYVSTQRSVYIRSCLQ